MKAAVHDHDRFDDADEPKPSKRPPACVLQWHLSKNEPIPDDVEVLAYDNSGRARLIYSQSNYLFEYATNENLDPTDIVSWAYLPPAPDTQTEANS